MTRQEKERVLKEIQTYEFVLSVLSQATFKGDLCIQVADVVGFLHLKVVELKQALVEEQARIESLEAVK